MASTSKFFRQRPDTDADRDSLTINGELLKLAWNVTTD
jgi:hypothetical protein